MARIVRWTWILGVIYILSAGSRARSGTSCELFITSAVHANRATFSRTKRWSSCKSLIITTFHTVRATSWRTEPGAACNSFTTRPFVPTGRPQAGPNAGPPSSSSSLRPFTPTGRPGAGTERHRAWRHGRQSARTPTRRPFTPTGRPRAEPTGTPLGNSTNSGNFTLADIDSGKALAELNKRALDNIRKQNHRPSFRNVTNSCYGNNVLMRKEWRTLSTAERKSFVAAVQCIMRQPVLSDPKRVPMAKSLYDDFVAVHYTSFRNTHLTASFFAWHRYYLATFEQKLRTECAYKGALPYWEWGLDINDPAASPVFDGSETSLGSDGAFIPHDGLRLRQPFSNNLIVLEPGSGGGCVKSGPFSKMVVHIGPAALAQYGTDVPFNVTDPLEDLPRCLKRDLNKSVAAKYCSFRNTTNLITQQQTIETFAPLLQGDDRFFPNTLGVHGGGHFIIGGDPGADGLIAPGDPAFWVHQAQVDRVYWIWQNLDFANRQGVFGTFSLQDNPKSPNGSVDDLIDLTPLTTPVKIKDLMNTVGGTPLCYMYE
ncbi:tyrosinase central domain-containing protein [Colletotrichum asianum]